ncbi:MAG: TIGR02281 family clan AA aspartic protease [Gammaproteobacteria bacterium]|nr:TIGR02281 family clan AA aspartic protease [Gammaproteobacteria bacterium]MBU1555318.1 TIGR02281 family clan AA aspartic protease [Gammaproteobacteria bacterium]MBU2072475.1 TIGR02281 family clan AA aspartic protease [Gammaproteobacteria bacterium]MBU2181400.1 TIGR02281 family clan AA aspartic protease [Gammaproteobacteria bacterium]MBU2204272.1 TIGR02281 family clan AA aspartic protease [Gammaproteobacteria bacterium]
MQVSPPTNRYGKTFAIIAWLIVMVMLYLFFQDTIDKQLNPNQQLHSVQGSTGETRTVLIRNKSGHYVGTALLNNQPADFMLDTGATTVAIAAASAEKLGLPFGAPMQVSTANGLTTAWRSRIDRLQLGDIVLYDIPASIVPNLTGTEILLGMSALKQLEFHQQGNQLTLIQH